MDVKEGALPPHLVFAVTDIVPQDVNNSNQVSTSILNHSTGVLHLVGAGQEHPHRARSASPIE